MQTQFKNYIWAVMLWYGIWYIFGLLGAPGFHTISYLGTQYSSVMQFILMMVGASILLWRASRQLPKHDYWAYVGTGLRGMAICMVLLVLFPYTFNDVLFWLHMGVSAGILYFGLSVSYVLYTTQRDSRLLLLLLLELASLGLFIYTFWLHDPHILWRLQFVYELATIYAFLVLLILASRKLPNDH